MTARSQARRSDPQAHFVITEPQPSQHEREQLDRNIDEKIHRQDRLSTINPPRTGPAAGATTATDSARKAELPFLDGERANNMAEPTGVMSPAPIPRNTRKTTS